MRFRALGLEERPRGWGGLENPAEWSRAASLISGPMIEEWRATSNRRAGGGHSTIPFPPPHFLMYSPRNCEFRRPPSGNQPGRLWQDTRESRAYRYELYVEQVLCTQKRRFHPCSSRRQRNLRDAVVINPRGSRLRIGYPQDERNRWLRDGEERVSSKRLAGGFLRRPLPAAGRTRRHAGADTPPLCGTRGERLPGDRRFRTRCVDDRSCLP